MIALEHTLIMLLLLLGLSSASPNLPGFVRWTVVGAILLAFVAPGVPLVLPWMWLSALVIPLLLWQIAYRLVAARWQISYRDIVVWLVLVGGITAVITQTASLAWTSAVLFGILVISMVWQAAGGTKTGNVLGMVGPLTLAFLIAEIDPAVVSPGEYTLSLLGGLGVGALIAYAAVHVALHIPAGKWRDIFTIGQVYLAYLAGLLLGVSSIAAALVGVIVYVAYGAKRGLWAEGRIQPTPLDSSFLFLLAAAALAFFAWQTHVPLAPNLIVEIVLSLLVVFLAILAGRWLKSPTFNGEESMLHILSRVALLLIPAVLLWQPQVSLTPALLGLALMIAVVTTLGAHLSLAPLLGLYRWLDEMGEESDEGDTKEDTVRAGDLMRREWLTVSPDESVLQIARQFLAQGFRAALVMADGKLAGIVTEADLFIKEERLPRTERTYLALFNTPIQTENLAEIYPRLAEQQLVTDIMTTEIISVNENAPISRVVRDMVRYNLAFMPVMSRNPGEGNQVVGMIARSDIIYALMAVSHSDSAKRVSL